jgi:hypothetical protein
MHHHLRPVTLEGFQQRIVADVDAYERERLVVLGRREVLPPPGGQVVHPDHPVPAGEQVIAQVGSDESCASRDGDGGHERPTSR